jgi:hypothetical protein
MGQYGQFEDMYQNTVSVAASSNVKGGMWLRIEGDNGQAAAHLSVNDAKVLISLLHKAVADQMEEE